MKKLLTNLIISLLVAVVGVANVNADGTLSTTISCPDSANAGAVVSCVIKATPSGFSMTGIQANYSLTNGTYSNFTFSETNFTYNGSEASKSGGFTLSLKNPLTSQVTIGTLKVKMGTTGNTTVGLTRIQAADTSYNTISATNVSDEIRISSEVNTLDSIIATAVVGGSTSTLTLSPAFSKTTTSYSVGSVNSDKITFSVTKTDDNSTVSGAGTKALNYGSNEFKIVVTAENGDKKTYTITATRPDTRDTVNTLASLSLSIGTLTPTFVPGTTNYTSTVDSSVDSIKVTATLTSDKSSFVKNYGSGRTIKLDYGQNKIYVKVISEKEVTKTYTVTVTRTDTRSSNNYLSTLSVTNQTFTFDKDTLAYTLSVNNNIQKVTIGATAEDDDATVTGTGEKTLKVGLNTLNVVVTAENGTKRTYVIKITRLEKNASTSSNTKLTSLDIEGYDIIFDNGIETYTLNVGDEVSSLLINYVPEDATSTVNITGNENLVNGSVVTVTVTSTDGTTKEFKINIVKGTSSNTENPTEDKPKEDSSEGLSAGALIGIISAIAIIIIGIIFVLVIKKRKENQF